MLIELWGVERSPNERFVARDTESGGKGEGLEIWLVSADDALNPYLGKEMKCY